MPDARLFTAAGHCKIHFQNIREGAFLPLPFLFIVIVIWYVFIYYGVICIIYMRFCLFNIVRHLFLNPDQHFCLLVFRQVGEIIHASQHGCSTEM